MRAGRNSKWIETLSTKGLKVWRDEKGRACVTLGRQHPYANSAGYQRVARFLIAEELGYMPNSMDHTHHKDRDKRNDSLDNLELINTAYHGQIHASGVCVGRGVDGRFVSLEYESADGEIAEFWWPRRGAILGTEALGDMQR